MMFGRCFRRLLPGAVVAVALSACVTTGSVAPTFERADVRIAGNVVRDFGLDFPAAYERARRQANRDRPNFSGARLEELTAKARPGTKLPVIVYFHGCAGIRIASRGHLDQLATLDDFVVFAPDSFARARPQYCLANHTVDVALAPQVTAMRRAEINHALKRIAALTWVDPANIFLIGHSQGAGTVAGYAGPVKIRGRVLINGSCNGMLGGDAMNDDEALLTLDSGRDPWFARYSTRCREYVLAHPEGRSIYEAGSTSHNLMVNHWPAVERFLKSNRLP